VTVPVGVGPAAGVAGADDISIVACGSCSSEAEIGFAVSIARTALPAITDVLATALAMRAPLMSLRLVISLSRSPTMIEYSSQSYL
jgi:hypothetical protein